MYLHEICFNRFLDDVALHHLIDALCKLSSEAMDVAYANKVFDIVLFVISFTFDCFCCWQFLYIFKMM